MNYPLPITNKSIICLHDVSTIYRSKSFPMWNKLQYLMITLFCTISSWFCLVVSIWFNYNIIAISKLSQFMWKESNKGQCKSSWTMIPINAKYLITLWWFRLSFFFWLTMMISSWFCFLVTLFNYNVETPPNYKSI